ncbi:MAG: cation transporter [Chloroflexi bacterium]|nr:cation transporter [Chloroflexota bacterium]
MGARHEHQPASAGSEGRLLAVLGLTLAYLVAQVVGGLLTGSLALLADAGHMLTDAFGLGMAVAALRFARRPATSTNTYGFYRTEILAALANGVVLLLVAAFILVEAWSRLRDPSEVKALPMLVVALGGLAVTLIGVRLLHEAAAESLNMRGAFLEVLGDLFGAAGAVVAALVILTTGWTLADPVVSALIGLLIVPRALSLLKNVVDVLLEAAPKNIDLHQLEEGILSVPGVVSVHDLHVWTITSGFVAMSGHVQASGRGSADVLHDVRVLLHDRYGIEHVTLQVEAAGHDDAWACCTLDPRCFVLTSR